MFNGQSVAGSRSLSGVLAHERTHGLIRARYGVLADLRYPTWLREGYCDVVAGGGALSDAEAARLKARHETIPALAYHDGRKRVEALLRRGRSVDALFAGQTDQVLDPSHRSTRTSRGKSSYFKPQALPYPAPAGGNVC